MPEETKEKPNIAAVQSLTAERDKELVAKLEEYVQLAKDGHLSDIAIIGKVRGASITEFEWDSDNPLELIGSLELAKTEIMADMLSEEDHDEDED